MLLGRCLTATSLEMVRAKDAAWLVSQVSGVMREHEVEFQYGDCQVLGGSLSTGSLPASMSLLVVSFTAVLTVVGQF